MKIIIALVGYVVFVNWLWSVDPFLTIAVLVLGTFAVWKYDG